MDDPCDPRTWPPELIAARNLALAGALGHLEDRAARDALATWARIAPKPQRVVSPSADRYTTGGVGSP